MRVPMGFESGTVMGEDIGKSVPRATCFLRSPAFKLFPSIGQRCHSTAMLPRLSWSPFSANSEGYRQIRRPDLGPSPRIISLPEVALDV